MKIRKWIHPALFTLGGALAGLAYYYFIGCASGSCPITSSPFGSMLYMGVIGYLVTKRKPGVAPTEPQFAPGCTHFASKSTQCKTKGLLQNDSRELY